AFDQIVSEAARTRYRSNGDWSVPIVIRAPFGGGVHGGLYHSQSIEAFYALVPGVKVVVPSMPADAHGLLKSAVRDPDPVLFLEHKRVYRLVTEEVPDGDHLVPIGPAAVRVDGPVVRVAAPDIPAMPFNNAGEELFMPSPKKIAEAMRKLAAY